MKMQGCDNKDVIIQTLEHMLECVKRSDTCWATLGMDREMITVGVDGGVILKRCGPLRQFNVFLATCDKEG